jgi:hypothetical protein
MGAWRVFVGFAGTAAIIVLVSVTFYALSAIVLYLGGRLLPLAGRRRRD